MQPTASIWVTRLTDIPEYYRNTGIPVANTGIPVKDTPTEDINTGSN